MMAGIPDITTYRHITDGEMNDIKARVANNTATPADFNATRAYAYQNGYSIPKGKEAMLPEAAPAPVVGAMSDAPMTAPTTEAGAMAQPTGDRATLFRAMLSPSAQPPALPRPSTIGQAPAPAPAPTPGPMAATPAPAPVAAAPAADNGNIKGDRVARAKFYLSTGVGTQADRDIVAAAGQKANEAPAVTPNTPLPVKPGPETQEPPQGAMAATPSAPLTVTGAPPQPGGGLADYYAQLEQERGLPSGYLGKVRHIESADGTQLSNPKSSARGDFQFLSGTAKQFGIDPMDPRASARAAADLAVQNRSYLAKSLGVDPSSISGGQLYLAHQQGAGGAAKLLQSNNEPGSASALLGADAANLNGGGGLSGAQMSNKWISAYNNAQPNYSGQPPITVTPGSAPGPMAADTPAMPTPTPTPAAPSGLASMLGVDTGTAATKPSLSSGLQMMAGAMGGGSKSSAPPMQMPAPADAHAPDMGLASLLARKKLAYGVGVSPTLQSPLTMGALG